MARSTGGMRAHRFVGIPLRPEVSPQFRDQFHAADQPLSRPPTAAAKQPISASLALCGAQVRRSIV